MLESEILVNVYRGDLIESIHCGHIAVIDQVGKGLATLGDSKVITYWRSAAKPFQALPIIFSGAADKYGLTEEELAIISASHSGEKEHVKVIKSILSKIGLDESNLLCGSHPPYHKLTAKMIYKRGEEPNQLHNNCSGKHAGILTLCQYYGWSIDDYYRSEHPAQQLILEVIAEVTDYPREKIYLGIDGCGVVVFGLPLKNMAYAYARLANPETLPRKYRKAAKRIATSMQKYPQMVAGSGRFNTDLMKVTGDKLIAKIGAEGIFCIGIPGQMGIAIKIEDGNTRAIPPVIIEILTQLNILSKKEITQLNKYHYPQVLNNRQDEVGMIKPVFKLNYCG